MRILLVLVLVMTGCGGGDQSKTAANIYSELKAAQTVYGQEVIDYWDKNEELILLGMQEGL